MFCCYQQRCCLHCLTETPAQFRWHLSLPCPLLTQGNGAARWEAITELSQAVVYTNRNISAQISQCRHRRFESSIPVSEFIIEPLVSRQQSLDSRHRLLCKQREDAKDLKVNLDRRENMVSTFLSRQLSAEQLQDYRRFVQTKASLLIRQKDLEEKQRLGEEQLEALSSSLSL